MTDASAHELPFAHGGPPLRARLRAEIDDFEVEEVLGFEASGAGEHVFLHVEKRDANTDWVAKRLAELAGVAPMAVGYAGLKDRRALTRQTFSVQLPGRAEPDWSTLSIEGVRLLSATRHDRKLKRGSHRGNCFRIRLRDVAGDRAAAEARIAAIVARGVPNYFGEQRFGRGGGNVDAARRMFAGARIARHQRGIFLSAARSEIFNAVLAQRVANDGWDRAVLGDVFMLHGTQSVFGPVDGDATIDERLARFDIHPTGPMWGRGALRTTEHAAAMERDVAMSLSDLADGLERAGLDQERRALRLGVDAWSHEWRQDAEMIISFRLERGAYATTVLRELAHWATPSAQRCDETSTDRD